MDMYLALFIKEVRHGSTLFNATQTVCWAKMATLVYREDWGRNPDPAKCQSVVAYSMAFARAFDAISERLSDEKIVAEYERGAKEDQERGCVWMALPRESKPTPGQLIRSMTLDEQVKAAGLLGIRNVAAAVLGADLTPPAPSDGGRV